MTLVDWVILGYFAVGLALSLIWWHSEYESEYEKDDYDDNIEVEEPMIALFILAMMVFWPIKLVKNYIEDFLR